MQHLRLFKFITIAGRFFDTVEQFLAGIYTDLFLQTGEAFRKAHIQKLDTFFQCILVCYRAPEYVSFLQQLFHLFLFLLIKAEQNLFLSGLMQYLLHRSLQIDISKRHGHNL